jgi:hypothetical protein
MSTPVRDLIKESLVASSGQGIKLISRIVGALSTPNASVNAARFLTNKST